MPSEAPAGAELGYNSFVYYAYILRLASEKFYVGHAHDLKKRLSKHNQGGVVATKNFRPVTLVFYAAFSTIEKARAFEKYLKSSSGKAFRNKRLI